MVEIGTVLNQYHSQKCQTYGRIELSGVAIRHDVGSNASGPMVTGDQLSAMQSHLQQSPEDTALTFHGPEPKLAAVLSRLQHSHSDLSAVFSGVSIVTSKQFGYPLSLGARGVQTIFMWRMSFISESSGDHRVDKHIEKDARHMAYVIWC